MKLEDQCVSLELAKKLKELGFRQDSLFYWKSYRQIMGPFEIGEKDSGLDGNFQFSAYTVAELGLLLTRNGREVMPHYVHGQKLWAKTVVKKMLGTDNDWMDCWITSETEADCRAKYLIHIKENNLIQPHN